ncbi:MAG TPA: 2-oxo acid dehydrogenase subunit E2, partial [Roseiarcus sp.]|nr:2-oxo acid dehydrogenase subunit E2 [Roseiarcus sp.]
MPKIDVNIPDIGDFKDVPVIEVLVKPGDVVKLDQPLVTLESDKATMDVPSPVAGTVTDVLAKVGDKVSMGVLIARVDAGGSEPAQAKPAAEAKAPPPAPPSAPAAPPPPLQAAPAAASAAPAPAPAAAPGPAKPDFSGVFAGPAVRRLARELEIDLNQIQGTGEHGRISREDVKAAVAKAAGAPAGGGGFALPPIPAVDFAKFGPIETVPLSRIKKISGPRLHASWVNIPHVTHTDEADVTDLEAFRKKLDETAKNDKSKPYRVSLLPLLMRAAVATLKAFPTFNAALSPAADSLVLRKYWHIGVAVDTPEGLVVAVVKDVDQKGVIDLARELGALSEKARSGKLAPA